MQTFVVRLADGKEFGASPDESILDAALRSGLVLPYSCRTGRCSTCKTQLKAGATTPRAAEQGLSAEELAKGWVLSCVRAACSDVELDARPVDGKVPAARTVPCRIKLLERLVPDVMRVVLRLPPTAHFKFLPGQYVDVIGPEGIRRSYSLAAAPNESQELELHVRRVVAGKLSAYWFDQARCGDLLRLHGPLGTFFLGDLADRALVFLATGTGIAPVKAMLEGLTLGMSTQRPSSIHVYWGARSQADLYWTREEGLTPHQFIPVLSRAPSDWSGARGYVQSALMADGHQLEQVAVYACGSNDMIHDARRQLVAAGLDERRFHSDAFVCSA